MAMSESFFSKSESFFSIIQVAACVSRDGKSLPFLDGCLHVVLPLVEERGYSLHANLFADTSPDRRKVCLCCCIYGDDVA